jgi:(S)-citramalyl-CoA lyase
MAQRRRRSTLFVGGLVLDGLRDALSSGADIVCIDLEDAVPPDRKEEARAAMVEALAGLDVPAGVQLIARINKMSSVEGPADLRAALAAGLAGMMLPMVKGAEEVRHAGEIAGESRANFDLYAIIENPDGLESCTSIARAHPRLKALFFGGFDMSAALGCVMAWEPLLYARSRVVHAAAMGGIEALDSPYPDVGNLEGLRNACEQVKALGMRGKCAKHASHVATINASFT